MKPLFAMIRRAIDHRRNRKRLADLPYEERKRIRAMMMMAGAHAPTPRDTETPPRT